MFGDLDWPLKASRDLSASAEFLVRLEWNGYNQYYFALDRTFIEAKLTGLGQMLEAEANILVSRPVWPWGLNIDDLLTFDISTSKLGHGWPVLRILSLLHPSSLKLGSGMVETDGQTDRWPSMHYAPHPMGAGA